MLAQQSRPNYHSKLQHSALPEPSWWSAIARR
jgi:hypothetical protein